MLSEFVGLDRRRLSAPSPLRPLDVHVFASGRRGDGMGDGTVQITRPAPVVAPRAPGEVQGSSGQPLVQSVPAGVCLASRRRTRQGACSPEGTSMVRTIWQPGERAFAAAPVDGGTCPVSRTLGGRHRAGSCREVSGGAELDGSGACPGEGHGRPDRRTCALPNASAGLENCPRTASQRPGPGSLDTQPRSRGKGVPPAGKAACRSGTTSGDAFDDSYGKASEPGFRRIGRHGSSALTEFVECCSTCLSCSRGA